MRIGLLSIIGILSVMVSAVVQAQPMSRQGIVAVVEDTPISSLDLVERAQLMIGTSGMSPTPEVRRNVLPQALKTLIEETLQRQEASKRGIRVTQQELEQAIMAIEQQNGRPAGSLQRYIEGRGLPWQAFLRQTEAQLIWNKLLAQVIRPKVRISDAEMERATRNRRFQQQAEEFNITPLVLPVEDPSRMAEVQALAERLVTEINNGARMEQVVRQFTGAAAGSEPNFWVPLTQLEPALKKAVLEMESPTGLVGPVRTPRGYHIVRVNDRRMRSAVNTQDFSEVLLKEVLLGLEPNATPKEVRYTLEIANHASKNPGRCVADDFAGFEALDDSDISVRLVRKHMKDLPEVTRKQVAALQVGEVGEPFATPEGIRMYMLCERMAIPAQIEPDDKLRETLFREKMELEATKFMRNLRRERFVEVRNIS